MNKQNEKELGLLRAREMYGEEVESALRSFLEIYDERFCVWLANLYLPRKCVCNNFDSLGNRICLLPKDKNGNHLCTGGGFYYSNSAKETDGYEIDIESTVQAVKFCRASGLIRGYENDFIKAFPKQMQLDICAFAKSLQSAEDGYFYHPQWGKNITVSRRGRDLTWSTHGLELFGDLPLYNTADGKKGVLGAPENISQSSAKSAENSSDIWPEHLKTLDAFKSYLYSLDMKNSSYWNGNLLNAQKGQIYARDKQAVIDGEAYDNDGDGIAEDGYAAALHNYISDTQNPENGLWSEKTTYDGVNGLMKIAITVEGKLNYAVQSFKSAMQVTLLSADEPDEDGKLAKESPFVYNPWIAMAVILNNVKKYGTSDEADELKALLKENAPELIKSTAQKVEKFKKPDGSFGYTWDYSPSFSQRAPVCPNGIIEGDINGGTIAVTGAFGYVVSTLGLDIPIYTPDDFEKFKSIINDKYKH